MVKLICKKGLWIWIQRNTRDYPTLHLDTKQLMYYCSTFHSHSTLFRNHIYKKKFLACREGGTLQPRRSCILYYNMTTPIERPHIFHPRMRWVAIWDGALGTFSTSTQPCKAIFWRSVVRHPHYQRHIQPHVQGPVTTITRNYINTYSRLQSSPEMIQIPITGYNRCTKWPKSL